MIRCSPTETHIISIGALAENQHVFGEHAGAFPSPSGKWFSTFVRAAAAPRLAADQESLSRAGEPNPVTSLRADRRPPCSPWSLP
jgi:hypothetical protein